MINKASLNTADGELEFAKNIKTVLRYIKSKGIQNELAEDLSQEVAMRITRFLNRKPKYEATPGLFIGFAKKILKEYWRQLKVTQDLYISPMIDEEDDSELNVNFEDFNQPIDFRNEKQQAIVNECFLECFETISEKNRVLLWRYSFEENKHYFDDEIEVDDSRRFQFLADTFKEIRKTLLPFFSQYPPMEKKEKAQKRVQVFRVREKVFESWKNCIIRKNKKF